MYYFSFFFIYYSIHVDININQEGVLNFFIPSYKIKNLAHLSHLNRVKKPLCYFQILKNKEKKLIKLISSALKFPFPI